ncbi:MAG: hemolysin family protein [Pyrinomonadaceae bacterium]|nr:hemolysin family protein [Pyrinomonadaceae bacterium]
MDEPASSFLAFFFAGEEPITFTTAAIEILLMFVLVALNGFFVAAEFSLVSARKTRLKAKADEGSSGAKAALRLLENPTLFISAVQLGVTLASLALGLVGEPTISRIIEPFAEKIASEGTVGYVVHVIAIVISFTLVTFLHIVFGELVPKMFALERAEFFATVAALPLELFAKVFSPLLWVFNKVGGAIGKLLGLKASLEESGVYTEDEIIQLVKLSHESGHLNEEEEELINKVFEFSDTTVKEAMIPRTEIVAIPITSNLEDIAKAFRQYGYSRLPVYGESLDDIKGVLHSKDVMQYFLVKSRLFKIEKVLKPPFYVVDTAKLEEVLRQMQKGKSHFGFVVDEHGGVEGIITLEDLLEEIVGDISDEHDEEVTEQIKEQSDGTFLLDGNLVVRDLNRRMNMNLPISESYTTIAGFLMSEAGQILSEGETVNFNGHTFKVEEVDKRRILKVRMEKS